MQAGRNLGLPQLAAPEDVPHAAPARFQQIGHRAGRRRTVLVAVGHQSTSQPIGADRRLAGTHTGPRATANVFERADGGILEPGRNVLRPDKLALAHQWLKRELVAVRLGNADLRRPVAQLVQLVVAIVERDARGRAGHRYAKPARDQVGDPLGHQPVGRHLAAHDAGKPGNPVALLVVDHGKVAAHFAALGLGA